MKKEKRSAYDVAVGYLSRREHATQELWEKLYTKGFLPEEIECTITKLHDLDLLSDRRYVEMIVRTKSQKKYGDRHIRYTLKQKGIEDSLIQRCLGAETDMASERITALINKKNIDIQDHKARQKLIQFLLRRGFSYDEIMTAINHFDSFQ